MIGSIERCNGCAMLAWEHLRGLHSAHCMDPDKPAAGIRRVLQVHRVWTGEEPPVIRPCWCTRKHGRGGRR